MNALGKGVVAGAFLVCIVLFIGMCIFIAGFSIVEPTYMAISRNKISSRIEDDKVYFEGRHYIGVSNEFILYPMAWQLVEFTDDDATGIVDFICKVEEPLDAATSESLAVQVEISLYFTIPPQQLINFYTTYGINYQDSLANECKKVLKETVTQFKYEDMFKYRYNISEFMKEKVSRALERRRCNLEKLLLRAFYFDDAIEETIEKTVVADQAKTENTFRNNITYINAEIEKMRLEYDLQITEILSASEKEATVIVKEARAEATSLLANSTAKAWTSYQTKTGLSSSELLRVQWARNLGSTTSEDRIYLGYDKIGTNFVQNVHSTN